MVDFREQDLVYNLKPIMLCRLLGGMYNHRSVPPRCRGLVKMCCLTLLVSVIYAALTIPYNTWDFAWLFYWMGQIGQCLLALILSLWTGDEYIYRFYTRNHMTDVTLDSPVLFKTLEEQMNGALICILLFHVIFFVVSVTSAYIFGLALFSVEHVLSLVCEFVNGFSYTTKLLVMGLFNCRLLVLRRRLERYGFRTICRAPSQPYCQIYDEIWQGLNATDNPLKFMLLLDLIFSSMKIVSFITYYDQIFSWQGKTTAHIVASLFSVTVTLCLRLMDFLGHVVLLESAAMHCEAMEVFTVTQLIKNPTDEERQRMQQLQRALEHRGARYRLLRALPLDARLAVASFGFSSAQALVLINILKT